MKNLSELWDFFQMKYLCLINKYVGMECTFECASHPSAEFRVHGESQSRDPSRSQVGPFMGIPEVENFIPCVSWGLHHCNTVDG